MVHINARCAILNVMQVHEWAHISVLETFAEHFSKLIPASYIDISSKAVDAFLEEYSKFVIKENDVLKRTCHHGIFAGRKFLDETINKELSPGIRQAIKEASEASYNRIINKD